MLPSHRRHPRFAVVASLLLGGQALASTGCVPPSPSSDGAGSSAEGAAGQVASDLSTGTHVVLLGTGTPNPDPAASGPATAVLVDGRAYLVDSGAGIVRRAAEAAERYAVEGLTAARLDIAFLTHLHSDHTVGLPDLVHTSWVAEREAPLRLFGPEGTASMAAYVTRAWGADVENRLSGRQPATPDGWRIEAVDINPGVVYEDERVRVTAFAVPHTGWNQAFGYRFDGGGRSVVLSGDTAPTEAIVDMCAGCDVLVHEVYSATTFRTRPPEWQAYHARAHTSTVELADIAARARPGILVLHHQLGWGATPEEMVAEIRAAGYAGPLAYGRDLDIY